MPPNSNSIDMATATATAAEEGTPLLHLQTECKKEENDAFIVVGTSSVSATVFNFTNSIVGAGCIALGGATAESGGLVSVLAIAFFALLSKRSFDLVIGLSREAKRAEDPDDDRGAASYEALGEHACGRGGRAAVTACKLVYSYGSLVAYVKIVKDNFASSIVQLGSLALASNSGDGSVAVAVDANLATILVGLCVMFPICLLRNVSALEKVSAVKVAIIFFMLSVMVYLWATSEYAEGMDPPVTFEEKWLEVRPGFAKSLGSFVFTFVAQHTINLTYGSLRPDLQTMEDWETVSSYSVMLSAVISMAMGLVSYATFWTDANSDIFSLYPSPSVPVALSKLFLSVMIMFTYPMTFLACRELCIPPAPTADEGKGKGAEAWWLLGGQWDQLTLPLHVALTFLLWGSTTMLAILAPSLLDVINLVGSATGTLIAFVLPALFSYRMRGYTHLAVALVLVGGSIGILGTYLSLVKLLGGGED